ncbi:hypothetical protein NFI96_015609 [Prochilodus magdalenae]|nr:hypothetical protein NFI96_015609 [Prochilodus magdalenae]
MPGTQRILKYSEELKMKKLVEELRKKSQRNYQQMRPHLEFPAVNGLPGQMIPVSAEVHHIITTPEIQEPLLLDVSLNSGKLQAALPTPSSLSQSALPPYFPKTSKIRNRAQPDVPHKDTRAKPAPKHGAGQEAVIKPAIASLAGTAKSVCMSKRPQPPAKPRSERPSSAGGTFKNRTHSWQEQSEKRKSSAPVQRLTVLNRGHVLTSSSSDGSTVDSEESVFDESEQVRQKHRKASKKTRRQLKDMQSERTTPKHHSSGSLKSSSAASTIQSVKSVAELLEEARDIAAERPQDADHQRVPQEANILVKGSGHEEELITSPQSWGESGASSSSELTVKEQKERELVDINIPDKEVGSQKDLPAKQQIQSTGEEKPTSGPAHYRLALSGSCKVDIPASQEFPALISDEESLQGLFREVLDARGSSFAPVPRPRRVSQQLRTTDGLSLLATWTPKTDFEKYKTIHHLCTTPSRNVLPVELQWASRVYHTQDTLATVPQFYQQRAADHSVTHRVMCGGVPVEHVDNTDQTDGVTYLPAQSSDALADWQRIAEYYVEKPRMIMCGHAAKLCDGQLRMFWSPAPPKFSCAPCVIKDKLFPEYQVTAAGLSSENLLAGPEAVTESGSNQMNTSVENILSRKHKSLTDLRAEESIPVPSPDVRSEEKVQVKRPFSAPHLAPDLQSFLRLHSDFCTISRELNHVQQQQTPVCTQSDYRISQAKSQSWHLSHKASQPCRVRGRRVLGKWSIRSASASQSKRKKGRRLSSAKLACILEKLQELPQTLTRSASLSELRQKPKISAKQTVLLRHTSLPLLLEFDIFAAKQGSIPDTLSPREWVRDIWNTWFDEVFPPPKDSSIKRVQQSRTCTVSLEEEKQPLQNKIHIVDRVDLSEVLDEGLTTADLEREVAKLTQTMSEHVKDSAFHLCRRGALYKKLGQLNQALEDLNAAISQEPHLLDAYWHRHSIYLLRNVPNSALEDLNFIINHNKKHADAFKSRAEIYRMRGETSLAIMNYTQAIKCKPGDPENYFRRAKMYEKTKETLLAMDDYAKVFAINPARTDALMMHGLHYFHTSNWRVALEDFTLLLKQEPTNARARTYRGRIFAKLGLFRESVEDLALAVHLDPTHWLAFYHRGCLLRKIKPDMALRDLSISVLINDGSENLGAFLHRGLLYMECQQWKQAMADFEAVIKIDRTSAVAYINLGLIYMLKMGQNFDAIKMFSSALKVDPTHLRGYLCRARAYHKVNDLQSALKDLTRAIHMRPDAQHLHIMRGQCLCDMELFDLATFCIQYAAEINEVLGSSVVQQAAVQSFLRNDAKAIACLLSAANSRPSSPILILLGKTQMKAHKFMEAAESFKQALSYLNSHEMNLCNVPEASELYYLTGMCYMAQGEDSLLPQALEAFSSAVRINPDYADAYHQRGLCRIRLQQSKGVQDLNRALYINPASFQVFLSRAAFYGAKGRYSMAVLSCNEAIKIQPKCVRAYLYRGALKFYSKLYKDAVEDLTMAIQIDNGCSFAYYNRGVCYQQLRQYELALRDYSIAMLLPNQKEIELKVLINRALVYVELNDHNNALQDFQAAAVKQPEDASIHHSLGVYYHRLGQLQEAAEAYSEALRLSPFLLDAYVGRGNVFMDYGHAQANKQAQRDFLSALHLNPQCSDARIGLAYNLQIFGYFQRAWNQFTVAVEVNPKCWAAYEGRAIVSLQMGNTCAAFQDINSALKCNPHSDQLLTNRGVINQFMGDKPSAMSDYQRAISLNPTCALAFFNAANLFFYNRQFEQACEYYTQAFRLDPSDESAILNRAITQALLRKIPESLGDFSEALSLNPHSAHVYFNRANLYCSLRKYKAAERDYTQALQLQPDDALLYKLRADVRGHLGLTEQAIQDYRTAVELQDAEQHPLPNL